jgi:hypothetical protein
VHTVGGMDLIRRRVPTGTCCGGNHPEQIEYRYVLVNGEEIPHGQSGLPALGMISPVEFENQLTQKAQAA